MRRTPNPQRLPNHANLPEGESVAALAAFGGVYVKVSLHTYIVRSKAANLAKGCHCHSLDGIPNLAVFDGDRPSWLMARCTQLISEKSSTAPFVG
jgi:hypothetical protein